MALWNPNSSHGPRDLSELELSADLIHRSLFAAVTDAELCSALDSPTAFGSTLWTRSNRYLREELVPLKWTISNGKLILRTIHPSKTFAITAVSASGGVADLTAKVRAKNPKGDATARLISKNGTMPFVYGDEAIDAFVNAANDDIPTWFLLYKMTKGSMLCELAYPVEMTGAYVDQWSHRLPLLPLEIGTSSQNFDGPDTGPDFTVEEL